MTAHNLFWPSGARLAVSFSLMFEAGGQPISGAGGVIPDPIEGGLPDLPTNAFFEYGVYEGIPRLLDLFDKHQVKISSFMIGRAVEKAPDLAREIVSRGHEAAAHGRSWENSYQLDPEAERRFIADGVASIVKATGQTPLGWNAYWMRNSPRTLDILQSLGFPHERHSFLPVPGLERRRLRAGSEGRIRPALRRRRAPPPHDGGELARSHLGPRHPRPVARPLSRVCALEDGRMVRPQRRDRKMGA